MSDEYGCAKLVLTDSCDESQFTLHPGQKIFEDGQVVNLNDYFFVKSYLSTSTFFMHVSTNPNNYEQDSVLELNAGYTPSPLKANLFMTHEESNKVREFI
jgi:hypothetical protein